MIIHQISRIAAVCSSRFMSGDPAPEEKSSIKSFIYGIRFISDCRKQNNNRTIMTLRKTSIISKRIPRSSLDA